VIPAIRKSLENVFCLHGTKDGLGVGVDAFPSPRVGVQSRFPLWFTRRCGGLGLGLGGLGMDGPEQFGNIQVTLEQVNRVQSLAGEVMFGMWVFHFSLPLAPLPRTRISVVTGTGYASYDPAV